MKEILILVIYIYLYLYLSLYIYIDKVFENAKSLIGMKARSEFTQ